MLDSNHPILSIAQPWNVAVPALIEHMQQAGLQVMRTFDLRETRSAVAACSCYDHRKQICDCQMVVLLVYADERQPASLIASGRNGKTSFSLEEYGGISNPALQDRIRRIFS
jgi:hypothetical protein